MSETMLRRRTIWAAMTAGEREAALAKIPESYHGAPDVPPLFALIGHPADPGPGARPQYFQRAYVVGNDEDAAKGKLKIMLSRFFATLLGANSKRPVRRVFVPKARSRGGRGS